MTQYNLPVFASPEPGRTFLKDNLEPWRDAVHSMHAGVVRPSYVLPQMMWIDTSATPWVLKVFQGSDDIILGNLDPVTLNFTPSAVNGSTVTGMTAGNVSATDTNTTGSTTVQGQLDYATKNATQAVAEAGTNNTDRMTALRTKQAIDKFNDLPSNEFSAINVPAPGQTVTVLHDGWLFFSITTTASSIMRMTVQGTEIRTTTSWSQTGAILTAYLPVTQGQLVLLDYSNATNGSIRNYKSKRVV